MSVAAAGEEPRVGLAFLGRIGAGQIILAAALLLYPTIASQFFLTQIGAYSLIWGLLALSLMLLAGYGGMVSLAQITTAGIAAYVVAIFGTNNMSVHGFGWPWWVLVPFAVLVAAVASALIGAISVRTEGIYTIMITLAIAAAFFYFAQQNYALFNGHSGYAGIPAPDFWGVNWRAPMPFYYLCLFVAVVCYAAVLYCSRSTFGLALQAIRDNQRRMRALGYRRDRAQGRRLFPFRHHRRPRGCAACLVQRPHFAGHRRCRAVDRRAGHRRHRRAAPPDRAVRRRRLRRPDPDLRHRYRRRRTLSTR